MIKFKKGIGKRNDPCYNGIRIRGMTNFLTAGLRPVNQNRRLYNGK